MAFEKQTILIVGGGGAGIYIAQQLSSKIDPSRITLQLVTERPYYTHLVGCLRMLVTEEGELDKRIFTPYDRVFQPGKAGEVIIGRVSQVHDGSVALEDGRNLQYDYLVLATGTKWSGPLNFPDTLEETENWVSEWRKKFRDARSIVLLGGGAVGTELAGEIRHFLPNKRVTIVHNQPYLINSAYPDKMRQYGTEKARNEGIRLVLSDRGSVPTQPHYSSITTEKGLKIETDLVVSTVGGKLNTEYLKSFDSSIVTRTGTVRVEPTLQVRLTNGKRNVYAAGDIIDWDEQKQIAKTPSHGNVVVANVLSAIKGLPPTTQYKGAMEGIGIPIGPQKGFGYIPLLWGVVMGDWVIRTLKGRDLFIDAARKRLGYTA